MMLVKLKISALKETTWQEYAMRLGLGGMATVATGLISNAFGPSAGGGLPGIPGDLLCQRDISRKA
jgi:hypothetical protein